MVLVQVITVIQQTIEPAVQPIIEMFSQLYSQATVEAWCILIVSLITLIIWALVKPLKNE